MKDFLQTVKYLLWWGKKQVRFALFPMISMFFNDSCSILSITSSRQFESFRLSFAILSSRSIKQSKHCPSGGNGSHEFLWTTRSFYLRFAIVTHVPIVSGYGNVDRIAVSGHKIHAKITCLCPVSLCRSYIYIFFFCNFCSARNSKLKRITGTFSLIFRMFHVLYAVCVQVSYKWVKLHSSTMNVGTCFCEEICILGKRDL